MAAENRKDPGAGSLRVDSVALNSIPSFHGLRHRSPGRRFVVLVVDMLQHGLGGLCASATQPFIEFIDAHGVRTLAALEGSRHAEFWEPG